MFLFDKVKNLELELFVAREQTNRSANSKLDHMLSFQKSPSEKTGLGFVESIFVPETHSTNFVPSSEPPVNKAVRPVEVTPPRKIRVDLKESKPKNSILSKDKLHDRPTWVCYFCGNSGHIRQTVSSCKLLREQINQKYLCLKHKILWYLLMSW